MNRRGFIGALGAIAMSPKFVPQAPTLMDQLLREQALMDQLLREQARPRIMITGLAAWLPEGWNLPRGFHVSPVLPYTDEPPRWIEPLQETRCSLDQDR